MRLSKENLSKINKTHQLHKSAVGVFTLPEKVLQFGTGVLLRALPDFIINEANNNAFFNGRIVVVKSTSVGNTNAFDEQNSLYTVCVKGIENGNKVEENHIVSSISRVLSATTEWANILLCATDPGMQIIISNTTEVGLVLSEDDITQSPPTSFPGKLLAFLLHRYTHFKGDMEKGMVIIPTELLPGNGKILSSIVLALAHKNNLNDGFIHWLTNANHFCSSLVDRIVPGKLPHAKQEIIENELGYTDELMIVSEPYYLWAIESDSERVKEILSFAKGNSHVVVAADINKFKELKLRLLNGSHTFSCGLAYLAGFTTVKEAMEDAAFAKYILGLMTNEIIPSICTDEIGEEEATTFAHNVIDRFSNNFIEHKWLSITMQYASKMATRNVVVIQQFLDIFKVCPIKMALGMAAHILFMKGTQAADGKFYGIANEAQYWINDDNAAFYSTAWKHENIEEVVTIILGNETIWHSNANLLTIFKIEVIHWLKILMEKGAKTALMLADNTD